MEKNYNLLLKEEINILKFKMNKIIEEINKKKDEFCSQIIDYYTKYSKHAFEIQELKNELSYIIYKINFKKKDFFGVIISYSNSILLNQSKIDLLETFNQYDFSINLNDSDTNKRFDNIKNLLIKHFKYEIELNNKYTTEYCETCEKIQKTSQTQIDTLNNSKKLIEEKKI